MVRCLAKRLPRFSADVAPDLMDALITLARKLENIFAIFRHHFQRKFRKDEGAACCRQTIKFDHNQLHDISRC